MTMSENESIRTKGYLQNTGNTGTTQQTRFRNCLEQSIITNTWSPTKRT